MLNYLSREQPVKMTALARARDGEASMGKLKLSGTALAYDVLRVERQPLDAIFTPRSVALVGATERAGSVGRTILENLIRTPFGGTVFPVNPKRPNVLGIKAYPSVKAIPDPVELVVIAAPAPSVPEVMKECVEAGAKGAIVISAGFKETGEAGAELERQILAEARRGRMRVIGPNCLGVMNPCSGLNATFATTMARPGTVGFVSQSGALMTAVLDWSLRANVGFSSFVSMGSMLDIGWGDMITHLGNDPKTTSIVLYMETVGDARSFLSAAREVALTKPIIVIKAGRTAAAAKAAASHTGSMTGSDDVLDAAFLRSGVLRVDTIAELFYMSEVLAKQPRPSGPRLTILTNAGGPGVLATDTLIMGGGAIAELSKSTMEQLDACLPPAWSHGNPVDILGDADPARYAKAMEIITKDPGSDALLVILTPQAMTDPTRTAEMLRPYAKVPGKPILASWMGGADVQAGEMLLDRLGVPTFPFPDTATSMFNHMWRYSANLRALYETPTAPEEPDIHSTQQAQALIADVLRSGRSLLTEYESKRLLEYYDIPTVPTRIARSVEEAAKAAAELGYPVVLKLHSETITHKTDVGGVKLNLGDEAQVTDAFRAIRESVAKHAGAEHFLGVTVQPMVPLDGYELILGCSPDPQFGPVLLFGMGGQLVEVFKDHALGLPPLTTTLARRMMEQTKIYRALKGVRGRPPVNLAELEQIMVRFAQMVGELPRIKELDINPLLASHDRLCALDARVVLYPSEIGDDQLPKTAIRPYPLKYVGEWEAEDRTRVLIRPIRPDDEPLLVQFHRTLSETSVYLRYFHAMKLSTRTAHERLTRICFIDYDRQMALVAEEEDRDTGQKKIVAIGRLTAVPGQHEAEFALLVSDPYQNHGLGTEILRRLLDIGRDEKVERITADVLPENKGMLRVCEKLNFTSVYDDQDNLVKVWIDL
jgi:acetyltransferase